jgi:nucleoside-diphosphate-sugar epimerase
MDRGDPVIQLPEEAADWRWTRGYVENVACAVALAATSAETRDRVYNVGANRALTTVEWVNTIGRMTNWEGRIEKVSAQQLSRSVGNTKQELVADTSRLAQDLNYQAPVPLHEGLRRTILWERENPPE